MYCNEETLQLKSLYFLLSTFFKKCVDNLQANRKLIKVIHVINANNLLFVAGECVLNKKSDRVYADYATHV